MGNSTLLPRETIVRATSGGPEAMDKVLRHYGKLSAEGGQREIIANLRQFCLSAHFVLWESCWGCYPKPAFLRLAPLEKSIHEWRFTAMKRCNTSHRHRVIKTRLTGEEFAEFSGRVTLCKMSQGRFKEEF